MDTQHIIVGAGAHGLALAYQLTRAGESVIVLEADTIASGASGGRGKRGVRANRRDIRELELARRAQAIWPDLAEELAGDTGYVRTGGLYLRGAEVSGNGSSQGASTVRAEYQSGTGAPTEVWDRDRVRAELPTVAPDVLGASYCPNDGVASHEATTRLYAHAAERQGAEIREHCPVASVLCDDDGRAVGVALTDGTSLSAGKTVTITANAATNPLLERSGMEQLPIWEIYPQAVFVRAEHAPQIPYLVAHDSKPLSVKIIEDDLVMLSGGWRGVFSEETGRGTVLDENVQGNVAQLSAAFPELGQLTVVEAGAARPESVSIDGIPIIDTVPGSPNTFVATGWTGHGWALVPAVADLLSSWISTGTAPDHLAPFSWTRFHGKV